MKMVFSCPVCGSISLDKQPGVIAPFIMARITPGPESRPLPVLSPDALRCNDCGFVCSSARYDKDEIAKIYSGYRGDEYNAMRITYEPEYAQVAANIEKADIADRKEAMREFLSSHALTGIKRWLDYGSGEGEVNPVDLYPGVEITKYDPFYNREMPEGKFDLVSCSHVLEHVSYPRDIIREIRDLSAKYIYIEVPVERTDSDPLVFHEHINFFNVPSLSRLMDDFNIRIIDMSGYNTNAAAGAGINLRCLGRI